MLYSSLRPIRKQRLTARTEMPTARILLLHAAAKAWCSLFEFFLEKLPTWKLSFWARPRARESRSTKTYLVITVSVKKRVNPRSKAKLRQLCKRDPCHVVSHEQSKVMTPLGFGQKAGFEE